MFLEPVYCFFFLGEVWSFSENVMHLWCAHITLTCDEVVNMVRNVAVNQPELKSTLYTRDDEIVVFSWLFAWMNVCRVNWVAFSEHVKCSNPTLQNYLWAISTVLSYTLLNAMPIDMMINFLEFYFFSAGACFYLPIPKALRTLFNWTISIGYVLLWIICERKRANHEQNIKWKINGIKGNKFSK